MYMDEKTAKMRLAHYNVSSRKMVSMFITRFLKDYYPRAINKVTMQASTNDYFSYPRDEEINIPTKLKKRQYNYYIDNYDIDEAAWFIKYIAAENNIEEEIFNIMNLIARNKRKYNWKEYYEFYYEDFDNCKNNFIIDDIVSATLSLVQSYIKKYTKTRKNNNIIKNG